MLKGSCTSVLFKSFPKGCLTARVVTETALNASLKTFSDFKK